jgi:hypothetical protein
MVNNTKKQSKMNDTKSKINQQALRHVIPWGKWHKAPYTEASATTCHIMNNPIDQP